MCRLRWLNLLELHNCAIYIQCQARRLRAIKEAGSLRAKKDVLKWTMSIRMQAAARRMLGRWRVQVRA